MKVNVLGTEYEVLTDASEEEYPHLSDADGYTDFSTKIIIIADMSEAELENVVMHENKVVRHELIHAFLYESGLNVNSEWARNEELIDWIAIQFPKMAESFKQIEV